MSESDRMITSTLREFSIVCQFQCVLLLVFSPGCIALDNEQVQEQFLPLINTKQLLTGTKTTLGASLCVSGYNGFI